MPPLSERVLQLRSKVDAAPDFEPAPSGFADFAAPVAAAQSLIRGRYTRGGVRTLHYWQGGLYEWTGTHYVPLSEADARAVLYAVGPEASRKPIKKRDIDNVLDALRAAANLSHRSVPTTPAWVSPTDGDDPDARALIPLRNGLLDIERDKLLPCTPRLFVPYALPFEHTADGPEPADWLAFLRSVWPDDPESIATLQDWFGYLLSADTSQQKALLIVGPKRSGKGTIGRVLVQLLGEGNVASPTLASLGTPFGLQGLIGRTCALMSDARLGAKADIAAIAENLLRLTGEDAISVPRKFQADYTARLLARVVVLANEVPTFRDAASALPSRFSVLRMEHSFLGREDHGLDGRLAEELPAIFRWALVGLRRLRERGRFVQPRSARLHIQLMEELASPVGAFLREVTVIEPGAQVPIRQLYERWCCLPRNLPAAPPRSFVA